MKYLKLFVLSLFLFVPSFAKNYCIMAFTTKVIYEKDKNTFLERFSDGIIKKYGNYYEFKLGFFPTYKDAKKKIKHVKKYYKDAFIFNCKKDNSKNITNITAKKIISDKKEVSLKKDNKLIRKKSFDTLNFYKVSANEKKPALEKIKILKSYQIPQKSKTIQNNLYDMLSFKRYISVLMRTNDKADEIDYQKKIDYILNEIKKDRYNLDLYVTAYIRTGSSISAQSGIAPNVNGEYSGAGAALHANMLLYDGENNLIKHTYDILNKRLAQIKELNAKDRLALFGVTIYTNLYTSQMELDIYNKFYNNQIELTKIIKKGYKEGSKSILDLIDSKNDLLNLKRKILNIQYQYVDNDFILRHSIKAKSKKQFKLQHQTISLKTDSLKLLQKEAIVHSSDIARESNIKKIKEADYLFQKNRYSPQINFYSYLGYGLSTTKSFDLSNPGRGAYWEMGLNLKMPIYNRDDIRLKSEKERLNILKQKSILTQKQREVLINIEKIYNDIKKIKKQKDILSYQLTLLQDKVNIAKKRYIEGVSSYKYYIDGVKQYLNSQITYLNLDKKYIQDVSLLSILIGKREFYE